MFVISYFPLLLIEFSSFYPRKFSIKKIDRLKTETGAALDAH